jgi:LmbE family N-acetylglucosaminyl deacetylase
LGGLEISCSFTHPGKRNKFENNKYRPGTSMMLPNYSGQSIYRVLCLGAHSDDIEIGCGGTLLRLARSQMAPKLEILWVVLSADPPRDREALTGSRLFLSPLKRKRVVLKNFPNSFFPQVGREIKQYFEELKKEFEPDLIFTHYRNDLHQDHRMVCDFAWNTFRNHLILEYEIPKYDGDFGSPNFFVHLDAALVSRKIKRLLKAFRSQQSKHWFTEDAFQAILRLRGIECSSPTRFAEAFYCRKLVIAMDSRGRGKEIAGVESAFHSISKP